MQLTTVFVSYLKLEQTIITQFNCGNSTKLDSPCLVWTQQNRANLDLFWWFHANDLLLLVKMLLIFALVVLFQKTTDFAIKCKIEQFIFCVSGIKVHIIKFIVLHGGKMWFADFIIYTEYVHT